MQKRRKSRSTQHLSNSLLGVKMLGLLVLSLITMTLDHKLDYFQPIRHILSSAILPIQYLVDRPITAFKYLKNTLVHQQQLAKENAELKNNQLQLSAKLQKLLALEKENTQLKALLRSAKQIKTKTSTAQLLSVSLSPFTQQVILNKGSKQGIFIGQPVLDEKGVMGQIISTSPSTSRVLLITDKLSAIPVQINRNGLRGILTGLGKNGYLNLMYTPDTLDIKKGDTLVTSGLGKRFPFGYPVGEIVDLKYSTNKHASQILVKPSAAIDRSRDVLLVLPKN